MGSNSAFIDWKQNQVTQEIMVMLKARVMVLQEELSAIAGLDPLADRYKVGAIAAYNDLINISSEEVSDGN